MITEKQLALTFSGFWQGTLPMLERHVRDLNLRVRRFAPPLTSTVLPAAHGLINEAAFRLFVASVRKGVSVSRLARSDVEASLEGAAAHVRGMRQLSRVPVRGLSADQLDEALSLARRHRQFFRARTGLVPVPEFPGCGVVVECSGDVLAGKTLYEIKAGDRLFRGLDVRQVLVYCALNFASKAYDIESVCLLNPRTGVFVQEELEQLCEAAAGSSAVEVLSAIVEYSSEHHQRYGLG